MRPYNLCVYTVILLNSTKVYVHTNIHTFWETILVNQSCPQPAEGGSVPGLKMSVLNILVPSRVIIANLLISYNSGMKRSISVN